MPRKDNYQKEIVVSATNSEFGAVRAFVEECFTQEKLSDIRTSEYILLVEELFVRAVEEIDDELIAITITVKDKFDELYVVLSYDGPRFKAAFRDNDELDLGSVILQKYEEKIGVRFRRGHNEIKLLVKRSSDGMFKSNMIAFALAVVIGSVLYYLTPGSMQDAVASVLQKFQTAFGTALLMISAPVTFFSFVTNITNTVVLADKRVKINNLIRSMVISSCIAIGLGLVYMLLIGEIGLINLQTRLIVNSEEADVLKQVETLIPTDIFSAFTAVSPFPLIILAIMTATAISTMNAHFEEAKMLNDTINRVFSSILAVIYFFLPFAVFVSVIEIILWKGILTIAMFLVVLLVCFFGMILMFLFNALRLKLYKCNVTNFFKRCIPAFRENFFINSTIDAIPYNTRFCNKILGIKMKYADSAVPIVSQLNLDGNCFLLTFISLVVAEASSVDFYLETILGLMIVIVGLSLGAPNQPGSLIIGLVVSLSFLGDASAMMGILILIEAFVGRFLTLINTLGNITTVYIEALDAGEMKKYK